jgi:hypothetical protein
MSACKVYHEPPRFVKPARNVARKSLRIYLKTFAARNTMAIGQQETFRGFFTICTPQPRAFLMRIDE